MVQGSCSSTPTSSLQTGLSSSSTYMFKNFGIRRGNINRIVPNVLIQLHPRRPLEMKEKPMQMLYKASIAKRLQDHWLSTKRQFFCLDFSWCSNCKLINIQTMQNIVLYTTYKSPPPPFFLSLRPRKYSYISRLDQRKMQKRTKFAHAVSAKA